VKELKIYYMIFLHVQNLQYDSNVFSRPGAKTTVKLFITISVSFRKGIIFHTFLAKY
jgi:hypothetical protein